MPGESTISWTDRTWNPTVGCTRVSAGCDHCYAFALHDQRHEAWKAGRFPGAPAQYHTPFSEVQLLPERLDIPLRWRKPSRIFVDSMADLFHADVPIEFIFRTLAVMAAASWHTFQILTKRPRRMLNVMADPATPDFIHDEAAALSAEWGRKVLLPDPFPWPLPNVWLGTSVENQEAAYRIDFLMRTPAAVRFLSCEPLLGPLDLAHWLPVRMDFSTPYHGTQCDETGCESMALFERPGRAFNSLIHECPKHIERIDWVIAGGESGRGHRPVDLEWVRGIRDQCVAAGVPFFFKQGSGPRPGMHTDLDGRTWHEFPRMAS